ncbi:hypothetical protein [Caldalkalibacillus salinus]|uniref:hypothetical protein n=1 Tax=Caldalkalibacillus salinus TaxID=2803787 RepID=UPI001920E3ED|nr:hypothetical protein [Caldalkalibacillus salinus]
MSYLDTINETENKRYDERHKEQIHQFGEFRIKQTNQELIDRLEKQNDDIKQRDLVDRSFEGCSGN